MVCSLVLYLSFLFLVTACNAGMKPKPVLCHWNFIKLA